MSATNPLFDNKVIEADGATLRVIPIEGRDSYLVEIRFPLDGFRTYTSKWTNPLRVALEAADEALNGLKCQVFNEELNSGKPMTKKPEDTP